MNSQNNFIWIDEDVVNAIHEAQIAEHGGKLGVRDPGLLASALNRPRNAAAYADPDVAELAALYALGVTQNHPCIDGNKRVAAVLLELFLDLNGYDLVASDEAMLPIMLGIAAGEIPDGQFITWVRENAHPKP